MISLKDYAEKHSVSYEAVRKQVNRYREDLGEHIYKVERTQYLDEEGEAFLDEKRASNPVVVVAHDKDEQIEELKQQNEALKTKVMQLQDLLISRDAKVMELQDRLLLLTEKPEQVQEPGAETVESEEETGKMTEETIQPDVQPLGTVAPQENGEPEPATVESEKPKKRWWEFWK